MLNDDVYSYATCSISISISVTKKDHNSTQTSRYAEELSSCHSLLILPPALGLLFLTLILLVVLLILGGTDKTSPSVLPDSRTVSRNARYS